MSLSGIEWKYLHNHALTVSLYRCSFRPSPVDNPLGAKLVEMDVLKPVSDVAEGLLASRDLHSEKQLGVVDERENALWLQSQD